MSIINSADSSTTESTSSSSDLSMGDAVEAILIDPNAPIEEDKRKKDDEVTAAESATTESSEGVTNMGDTEEATDEVTETTEAEATEEEPEATEEVDTTETEEQTETASDEQDADDGELEGDEVMFTSEDGTEVTLDELKRGYLRQSDYTKKTQEVAENRQQLQAQFQEFDGHRQVLAQHLEMALNVVEPQLAELSKTDWDTLASNDPYEYAERKALHDQALSRYQQLNDAAQTVVSQEQTRVVEQKKAMVQAERQKLAMALPDMADPVKGRKLVSDIREFAMSQGLTETEAKSITDHRLVVILNKARQFDQLKQSKLSAADKKLRKGPRKVLNSGKPQTSAEKSAASNKTLRDKLAATGSVDDAVELLLSGGK